MQLTRNQHIRAIGIAAVYYAVMRLSLLAVVSPENVSVLWLPSGFLTAILLLTPRRAWAYTLLWVGAVHVTANFVAGHSAAIIAGYMLANGTEVVVASLVYQWVAGRGARIDSIRAVISLPLLGLGSVASATIAAATSVLVDGGVSYVTFWSAWVMSSFDSMLVITPAILVLARGLPRLRVRAVYVAEAGLLLALLGGAVAAVFGSGGDSFLYLYLPYPLIIWAALRFRVRGAVLASMVLAVISIVFTVLGRGAMAELMDNPIRLLWLQAYLGGAMLTGLVVAAAMLERERAEARVRLSEARYQTLADSAPVGIFRVTVDGTYRYSNATWSAMIRPGGSDAPASAAAPSRSWLEDVIDSDRERVQAVWREAEGQERRLGIRFRIAGPGEVPRAVFGQIAAERDSRGQITGYVGSVTDLSELEKSELARNLLAAATAQADDGIVAFTADWCVVYLNDRYAELAQITRREALGKDLRGHAGSEGIPWSELETAVGKLAGWRGTVALGSGDDARHENISLAPVRDGDGAVAHFVIMRRDVTEEFRLASELQQAQKMEAVGVLAGGIAHDFNNLLTAIIGSIELVRMQAEDEGRSIDILDLAWDAALAAGDLTRDLLTLSRRVELRARACNVNELVGKAVRLLRLSAQDKISVDLDLAPELPTISADQGQLTQAVLNLVLNARDAMGEGGELRLSSRLRTPVEAELEAHPHAPTGRYIEIRVEDTGTGIDRRIVDKIFDPFYTTKQLGGGTGLGLAMVYACAQAHRGWVSVTSTVGSGTEFSVMIPAVHHAAVAPDRVVDGEVTGTILLVDDTPMVLDTTRRVLEAAGFSVEVATGGHAALALFDDKREQIDLVLTDSAMPDGDGRALLRGLRDRGATIPVILTSGFLDVGSSETEGFTAFVPKPFSQESLTAAVRGALTTAVRGALEQRPGNS